jgi:hypothetical protein
MALHREAPISAMTDMESAPTPVVHDPTQPSAALDDRACREILEEAAALLKQVLTILGNPIFERHRSPSSFRLARAHALTLLDHLAGMADSPPLSSR